MHEKDSGVSEVSEWRNLLPLLPRDHVSVVRTLAIIGIAAFVGSFGFSGLKTGSCDDVREKEKERETGSLESQVARVGRGGSVEGERTAKGEEGGTEEPKEGGRQALR